MNKSGMRLLCLLATIPISAAYAQHDEEDDLEKVYGNKALVSIATGSKQQLALAPAITSVLTSRDFQAMGLTDLDQALAAIPGLHVSRSSILDEPLFTMRGISHALAPHVLLLQDGLPLSMSFTGSKNTTWVDYPLNNVARIEVIRGPGSALYGADAFSGVVNIITKKGADKKGFEAGLRHSNDKRKSIWLNAGAIWGDWATAGYLRIGENGRRERLIDVDGQLLRDRQSGSNASLAPGFVNDNSRALDINLSAQNQAWTLLFDFRQRRDIGTGAGVGPALDPVGRITGEMLRASARWKAVLDSNAHWELEWQAAFSKNKQIINRDLVLYPPGARFPTGVFPNGMTGHPDVFERHALLSAHLQYSGWENHRLRLASGFEDHHLYETRTIKNYEFNALGIPVPVGQARDYSLKQPFLMPQRRRLHYVYAQDEWNLHQGWNLTSGIRHDAYSDFGASTNLRMALVWAARRDMTFKFLYGTAFRAPSFNEAYSINNPVNRGNPALRPERISTLEGGFNWQATDLLQTTVNLYAYRMKDMILSQANPAPGIGSTFQNAGRAHGKGLEMEAVWDNKRDWRLSAHYSYQRAIDDVNQRPIPYLPQHRLYLRTEWQGWNQWRLGAQANGVFKRARAAQDNRPAIANYHTLDLSLRRKFAHGSWDLALLLTNLGNADARDPSSAPGVLPNDYPLAGRAFALEISHHF
ncbi:TonB-dependent receptor [Massilia sp. W12]|uniref:TonB-dependent receptor plug domain-containing protein n=1 Tax=Massilia sp. W12 TaxID=3126507 RepID=UPI0030D16234